MARVPYYRLVIREPHATTYGPTTEIIELDLHKNLGWSEIANDVGEMFFTLTQGDPKLTTMSDAVNNECFAYLYRGTDLVWAGRLAEADETETDVVFYAYSHVAELFWLHTPWNWARAGDNLAVIVNAAFSHSQGRPSSRTAWMASGTIEAPATVTGGGTPIILPSYTANYKRILFVMQEMAGLANSDTENTTRFEINPLGTFNFLRTDGTDREDQRWEYGGNVIGYHRVRTPGDIRNVSLSVGSSPNDILLRKDNQITADIVSRGRKEEALFFEWVRDETELQRVNRLRIRQGARIDNQVSLSFMPGAITPYRATGASFALFDRVPVRIDNGATQVDRTMLVVGQQIVLVRGKEHVRVFLEDNRNDVGVEDDSDGGL